PATRRRARSTCLVLLLRVGLRGRAGGVDLRGRAGGVGLRGRVGRGGRVSHGVGQVRLRDGYLVTGTRCRLGRRTGCGVRYGVTVALTAAPRLGLGGLLTSRRQGGGQRLERGADLLGRALLALGRVGRPVDRGRQRQV